MALIQTVHLSMANFKSAPVVPAVQNDTDRQVKMIIDDYTLTSGLTGKIAFERSDGTHYETAAELVLADNAFVADIDQALTQPGRTMVQLKVTDTLTVSTFSFVIFVEADNSGTVTPQEGIDLVSAVEAAEDAADRAEEAAESLELDATLTSSTKAAQAKAVGDALLHNTTKPSWEVGSYNYPNGANYTSSARIRLTEFVGLDSRIYKIKALTGYEFSVYAWAVSDDSYVGALMASDTFATSGTLKWVESFDVADYPNYKFKVALRNQSLPTSDMTVEESSNCIFLDGNSDKTLSIDGAFADAKSTGDKITDLENYFDESPNLINPATVTVGMVISTAGEENSSTKTDTSDYIEVEPGSRYSWKNLSYVCRYGENKSWLGRTSGTSQDTILLASTVHYVRVCGATDTAENWRFNKGTLVDKPYHEDAYLKNVDIRSQVDEIVVPMLHQTTESAEGLFENGKIALSSGNLQDDTTRLRSITYLPRKILTITANTGYEFSMYGYQDDQYKGNWNGTLFTKTGTAKWFTRESIPVGYDIKVVVRSKTDPTITLDPYNNRNCLLFYEYLFEIQEPENILDRVIFSENINDVFGLTETPVWTGTAQTMTSAQVYALFDALAENYPTYITKQPLGDDEWDNPMAIYKCSPVQPTASYTTKIPKIFINCSIHGYEHVPPITMYLVLKKLCEDWQSDPLLNILRHEVELNILPVANPSGFNAYTRKNGNGIDLNRNFPAGFSASDDPSATDYGGTTALSEKETQYIYNWLNTNRDTDVVIDFHNFGAFSGSNIDWVTIKNRYQAHIARVFIQRMTQKFRPEYSWLPQGVDNYYGYTSGVLSYNGLVKDQASAFGVPYSYTFELPRSLWGTITDGASTEEDASMAPIHRKICCECLVNFLILNLVQLERYYSYQ